MTSTVNSPQSTVVPTPSNPQQSADRSRPPTPQQSMDYSFASPSELGYFSSLLISPEVADALFGIHPTECGSPLPWQSPLSFRNFLSILDPQQVMENVLNPRTLPPFPGAGCGRLLHFKLPAECLYPPTSHVCSQLCAFLSRWQVCMT